MSSSTESSGNAFASFLAVVGAIIGLAIGVDDTSVEVVPAMFVGAAMGGIAGWIATVVLNAVLVIALGAISVLVAVNRIAFLIELIGA